MKKETYVYIAIAVFVVFAIKKIIAEGKNWIGNNPLGAVGNSENPGWWTKIVMQNSGNPRINSFYDPLGFSGARSLGFGEFGNTVETWVDPLGWWFQ